jgi:hypothetical protein
LDPGLLLGDQALHELGPFFLVGLDPFVQQHLADLDSVGGRCATGLHKLGAQYAVPNKPMPAITAALVGATLAQRLNTNRAWPPLAHVITVGEHTAKVNSTLHFCD